MRGARHFTALRRVHQILFQLFQDVAPTIYTVSKNTTARLSFHKAVRQKRPAVSGGGPGARRQGIESSHRSQVRLTHSLPISSPPARPLPISSPPARQTGLVRIADASGTVRTDPDRDSVQATTPQKPEAGTPVPRRGQLASASRPSETARPFDPEAYAAKLQYTEDVAALGISEEDALALGIGHSAAGMHKGIAFALRWPTGEIAGFCSVISGEVKLPKSLIPSKVVQLRRA
jgi:hypothetical protein